MIIIYIEFEIYLYIHNYIKKSIIRRPADHGPSIEYNILNNEITQFKII